ncbi:MAG: mobilization protein MobD [Pseudomonadota bacterium]|nr:mobilization protein MobD [Pseudomonadota bacterium]
MSMIHFIGGEKGGVGKSVMARLLSQYFLDRSWVYAGLDADQSHPTLTRYYRDFTQPINLDLFESTDEIMEVALEGDRNVLIDLPAQSQRFLDRWIEANDVIGLCAEMGIPLVYWYLVDAGPDSAQLLDGFLQKYGRSLHCAVVKNEGCGSDFSAVEAISANDVSVSPQQITLPALHGSTMRKIDRLNLSFWAAIHAKDRDAPHLSVMERQRTKVWIKKAYAGIDEVISKLVD